MDGRTAGSLSSPVRQYLQTPRKSLISQLLCRTNGDYTGTPALLWCYRGARIGVIEGPESPSSVAEKFEMLVVMRLTVLR